MYELSKNILKKVSFDKFLFKKELEKAIKWLKRDELTLLRIWCLTEFGHLYGPIISDAFKGLA